MWCLAGGDMFNGGNGVVCCLWVVAADAGSEAGEAAGGGEEGREQRAREARGTLAG